MAGLSFVTRTVALLFRGLKAVKAVNAPSSCMPDNNSIYLEL
jgi:hypothetical protein